MSKKVKVRRVKQAADTDMAKMFNQMLGAESVNLPIAYSRYRRMEKLCLQIVKLFGMFAVSPVTRIEQFKHYKQSITKMCNKCRAEIDTLFSLNFSASEWNLEGLLTDKEKEDFQAQYRQVKSSQLIKSVIIMCNNLVKYKKHYENISSLSHTFIVNMAGVDWKPFMPFTSFNVKELLSIPGITTNVVEYIMTIVHKAYSLSYALYVETQEPDIDLDEFIETIMANMDKIQSIPELSRCKRAFAKIRDSVSLLKTNFSTYYMDFVETRDNTIIMQHFITDVAKETSSGDARLTGEFRRIIEYYRKATKMQTADPRMSKMFDTVDRTFATLDKAEGVVAYDDSSE